MEIKAKERLYPTRINDLCRICLTAGKNNRCIFESSRNESRNKTTYNLLEKLRLCSGVEVAKNDGLPTSICPKCVVRVNDAHALREQCQRADGRLRELYGKVERPTGSCASSTREDRFSQTEHPVRSALIETERGTTSKLEDEATLKPRLHWENGRIEESNGIARSLDYGGRDEMDGCDTRPAVRAVSERAKTEKSSANRATHRTRRAAIFKRMTSMENLKNHKERQRQYIKKTASAKRDTYVCSKCGRCYSSKKSLDRHNLTHSGKRLACEKCNKYFLHVDKLLEHGKLHEGREKSNGVSCKICNKNFRKPDTMVRHLNVHKRANPREVFSILKEIRDKRRRENSEGEPQKNGLADRASAFPKDGNDEVSGASEYAARYDHDDLSRRVSIVERYGVGKSEDLDDSFFHRCKHCAKEYATERSLQRHMLMHDEKKFVCKVCSMKFFRQDRLKSHKDRYGHDEDKAELELQKPTDDKSAIKLINTWIREELDSDNEEKGFPCKICGKSYDTKKSLVKHQANTHEAQEECVGNCGNFCRCVERSKEQEKTSEKSKPYTCEECNKSFEKEVKLQRHARIHERAKEQQDTNFKRFLCHICSKTFRQNTGLMFHMRTHTGYKPHVCKYCGRGFTSNSNCINHERTHTGDRPFVCHFCSAAFAKSCTLKAHITTHTGEANYHCKTCGKSFRRLKYLKEHKFTHTGEKPYACKICGTAYSHSGSLFVHEKKCKAQYAGYQPLGPAPGFAQAQATPSGLLAQAHPSELEAARLLSQPAKGYALGGHRAGAELLGPPASLGAAALQAQSDSGRHFAPIGQIFHS
ncbi:hypothetical protein KM043_003129 [Ampulex compressa]|nr:hypothetical protein KM043_003129 [Ampulex compressa]